MTTGRHAADSLTFAEKWHHRSNSFDGKKSRGMKRIGCYITYMVVSNAYTICEYVVPFLFGDFSEMTRYYIKVFVVFMFIQFCCNWFGCLNSDSTWTREKARDRPYWTPTVADEHAPGVFHPALYKEQWSKYDVTGYVTDCENENTWKYCDICEIPTPPRCHHCKTCGKCILKRDHHCYVIGTCIGFNNQRFFVVLGFYCIIVGIGGSIVTVWYLMHHLSQFQSVLDLIPGFSLVHWLIYRHCDFHISLMYSNVIMLFYYGVMGLANFCSQMSLAVMGTTMHEQYHKLPVRVTASIGDNLTSVFGAFWFLNFLVPVRLVFKQTGDGLNWPGIIFPETTHKLRLL